jgi:hypothetical protein
MVGELLNPELSTKGDDRNEEEDDFEDSIELDASNDEDSLFGLEAALDADTAGAADGDVGNGKGLLRLADADRALERLDDEDNLCEML